MKEIPIIMCQESVQAIMAGTKTKTRRILQQAFDEDKIPAGAVLPARESGWIAWWPSLPSKELAEFTKKRFQCPYGQPGDRLWVKETWAIQKIGTPVKQTLPLFEYESTAEVDTTENDRVAALTAHPKRIKNGYGLLYQATASNFDFPIHWRSPVCLPRWASRLTLELTDIQVERIQEITEEDEEADLGIHMPQCIYFGTCHIGWHHIYDASGVSIDGEPDCSCGEYSREEINQAIWDSFNAKRGFPWKSNPWVWVLSFNKLD